MRPAFHSSGENLSISRCLVISTCKSLYGTVSGIQEPRSNSRGSFVPSLRKISRGILRKEGWTSQSLKPGSPDK
eukprot:754994-Hanusia_phi.AAC.3